MANKYTKLREAHPKILLKLVAVINDFSIGATIDKIDVDMVIPGGKIDNVPMEVLQYLFNAIAIRNYKDHKVFLLKCIIRKCRSSSDLRSLGGVKFFNSLIVSRDAHICLLASKFLVEQICLDKPHLAKEVAHIENPYEAFKKLVANDKRSNKN